MEVLINSVDPLLGRTAIPFVLKYVVPATEKFGADLLELAASELAEVVIVQTSFKMTANSVEANLRNN